ncbi:hypothetical protein ScPMuIL_003038 [Solemya velum]
MEEEDDSPDSPPVSEQSQTAGACAGPVVTLQQSGSDSVTLPQLTNWFQGIQQQDSSGEVTQIPQIPAGLTVNFNITSPYTQLASEGGKNEITHVHPPPEPAENQRNSTSRAAFDAASERIETMGKSEVFVKTKVVGKLFDILKNSATILQVGNPGQGKTENCIFMMYAVCKVKIGGFGTDWVPYIVTTAKELKKVLNDTEKQIILVDDFLGSTNFIESRLQDWLTYFETNRKFDVKKNTKLMFTSRKHIFQIGHDRLEEYKSFMGNIVDLTQSSLDRDEKKDILNRYLKSHEVASPVGESSAHSSITEQKKKVREISEACGEPGIQLQHIREAADSLVGSFLTREGSYFRYIHESLMDAVCVCFGQNHGGKAIEHCSIDVLVEFVRTPKHQSGRKTIMVHDKIEKIFIRRLYEALIDTDSANKIMCHDSFEDEQIVEHFFETIKGSDEMLDKVLCMKDENDNSFLVWACRLGRVKLFESLLKSGANIEEKVTGGGTMFHLACVCERKEIIDRLAEHLGPRSKTMLLPNHLGKTPLHLACQLGLVDIVEMLLKHGAKVVISDKDKAGKTALFYSCGRTATDNENFSIITSHLLKHGAASDIDVGDKFGKTPLHRASILGKVDIMRRMLDCLHPRSAAIHRKDRGKRTPLHLACNTMRGL